MFDGLTAIKAIIYNQINLNNETIYKYLLLSYRGEKIIQTQPICNNSINYHKIIFIARKVSMRLCQYMLKYINKSIL